MIVGRYQLIRQLGAGGMGTVWLARDTMLGREVAVKEVVLPDGLSPEQRAEQHARTMREARTAAALNHPNVVKIYDVVQVDGRPYIVMEYVPSRSLHDVIIESGTLEPARAAQIGVAVLDALTAAHRAGVLHRDVKPGNVLIGTDGRVVLTDFGLATFDGGGDLTRPGLILGSPQFVAPERARDGSSTPEADLWSLGATLYAAVEGRSPYERSTAMATLTALATTLPDPPRQAGALRPVLSGLLRRNPRDRMRPQPLRELLTVLAQGGRPAWHWRLVPGRRRSRAAGSAELARLDQRAWYPGFSGELDRPRPVEPDLVDPDAMTRRLPARTADDVSAPPAGAVPPGKARPLARTRAPWRRTQAVLAGVATVVAVALGTTWLVTHARHPSTGPEVPAGGTGSPVPTPTPAPVLDPVLGKACPASGGHPVVPASQPGWDALAGGGVWYLDPAGYRVGVRPDWIVHSGPDGTCFRDPGSTRVLAILRWTPGTGTALAHVTQREQDLLASPERPDGYQSLGRGAVSYYQDAAQWEYTYRGAAGVAMHAQVRDFQAPRGRGFTIVWLDRDSDWQLDLALLRLAEGSFVPPPAG